MSGIRFVPQTGTKQDNQGTRKLIRRHVMLGKNQGRTQNPKQPTIDGAAVFRKDDWPIQSVVPRRVGSDLSFLDFADTVELSLMNETLHFCSATNENLFVLEPCISFDSENVIATCLQSLACDALYLNVLVFSTQAFMDQSFQQTTSKTRGSPYKSGLQHYGKALFLLRERLADDEQPRSKISDTTIMSIVPLAMHAMITGEDESARNHVVGLTKLVSMRDNGFYSFKNSTRHMIELLRCDISISLATGQPPLFFSEPFHEDVFPLPELLALDKTLERRVSIANSELAEIWDVFRQFCAMINKAAVDRRRLPQQVLLDTMASVMYRLLNMSITPGSTDETTRLAMLSVCASTFLPWRGLRMSFGWLQLEFKRCIARLMQCHLAREDPELVLWFLTTYGIAFSPLLGDEREEVQLWLMEVTDRCELTSWDRVKKVGRKFLWIDIVCNHPAQKLIDETLAGRLAAIDMFDVLC